MKSTKNIILWILSIFMLTGVIAFGFSLSSILLIMTSILLMPIFNKHINKIIKSKGIKLGLAVVLFLVAIIIAPITETSSIDNDISSNDKVESISNTDAKVSDTVNNDNQKEDSTNNSVTTSNTTTPSNENTNADLNLKVTFLDVGQADCIVIQSNDDFMVIDGGNNVDIATVTNFLKSEKIENIQYLIGTHPHEDHIGGLDAIINNFNVETIIMPEAISDTETFEDVITAIENKKLEITAPKVGDTYTLGSTTFTIIAPNKIYSELNNMSVGIKLTNGENSFVFAGDAEVLSENDIIDNGIDLKANVLKLSHHGSNTSTSKAFLKAVSPKHTIISVGKDNSYGHPNVDTLKKLLDSEIELYRTDLQGNIVITSDGKDIKFNVESCDIAEGIKQAHEQVLEESLKEVETKVVDTKTKEETNSTTTEETKSVDYILNKNSDIFHHTWCGSVKLMKESNKIYFTGDRNDVINQGYDACKKCNP